MAICAERAPKKSALFRSYLNFVPADLIGGKVQREGILVGVDCGGLRLVGVVDDAVFAVFDKGVNLYIIV